MSALLKQNPPGLLGKHICSKQDRVVLRSVLMVCAQRAKGKTAHRTKDMVLLKTSQQTRDSLKINTCK